MSTLITDVRVFLTAPDGQNLLVVRVDTNQPGLYGLGCGTNAYRVHAVREMILHSLRPLLIGRDASRIEDLWQLMYQSGYWRGGPVAGNAVSGIDMALWDIKAKEAGMPLYALLGGRCRDRLTVYRHCNASTREAVLEKAEAAIASGCRCVRVAYTAYDGPGESGYLCLQDHGTTYDPHRHMREIVSLLEAVRARFGEEVGLITDTHERLDPADAVTLACALEPLRLTFMEDPVSPEQLAWLAHIRQRCATPIAIGENFVSLRDCRDVIVNGYTDYIRCHLSAIGGLTPARKLAHLAESFGVKTAWHGALDMTPIALAVQGHLGLASPNFGIQEYYGYGEATAEVFPGMPQVVSGAMTLSERPGHGVEFDETQAAKYPPHDRVAAWTEMRLPDGTLHTP